MNEAKAVAALAQNSTKKRIQRQLNSPNQAELDWRQYKLTESQRASSFTPFGGKRDFFESFESIESDFRQERKKREVNA